MEWSEEVASPESTLGHCRVGVIHCEGWPEAQHQSLVSKAILTGSKLILNPTVGRAQKQLKDFLVLVKINSVTPWREASVKPIVGIWGEPNGAWWTDV